MNTVTAYVGLGANLGDRAEALDEALRLLRERPALEVRQVSSLYETAPVGVTNQPKFLNAAAEIETTLSADALLRALLEIENKMGRVRTLKWGPRVIDLDLLVYGDIEMALPHLTVPHPRLRERAFVLVPLAEIAPELVLPGGSQAMKELANNFYGDGNIRRIGVV